MKLFAYFVNIVSYSSGNETDDKLPRESFDVHTKRLKGIETSFYHWAHSPVVEHPVCNGETRVQFSMGPLNLFVITNAII